MKKNHVFLAILILLASTVVSPTQSWSSSVVKGSIPAEIAPGSTSMKEAQDVEVKTVPVTLASEKTMNVLRTDWLKEVKQGHLSREKPKMSGSFWMVIAILAVLPILVLILIVSGTFNRFGINAKLYTSYGSLVLLSAILGVAGYFYLDRVYGASHLEAAFLKISMMPREMHVAQSKLFLHGIDDEEQVEKQVVKIKGLLRRVEKDFTAIERSSYLNIEQFEKVSEIKTAMATYAQDLEVVAQAYRKGKQAKERLDELDEKFDEILKAMSAQHEAVLARLEAAGTNVRAVAYQSRLVRYLHKLRVLALKVSHDEVAFRMDKRADRVDSMAMNLSRVMGYVRLLAGELQDPNEKAKLREVEEGISAYGALLRRMILDEAMIKKDTSEMINLLQRVEINFGRLNHEVGMMATGTEKEAQMALIVLIVMALVAGTLFSGFIARGIFKPINRVINGLTEGAEQVAAASGEVSSASQELAEGSAEQAASLAETSACLEEMASTTKQNAEHAIQANNLMQEANQVVAKANEAMKELNSSMEEINKASKETQEIVKSIDDIAFQTNLLALNAAVEAARAGEAGAGFAVVADEVRNLAMRAAEAAKNTANLIEGTVMRVNKGSSLVQKSNEAFEEVAKSAAKVGELVSEIAAASDEQSQGIEQMNNAVNEIDKVAQQNAANAEESAAASQQMSAQAQELKSMLGTFKLNGRRSERKLLTRGTPKRREALTPEFKEVYQTEKRANKATHTKAVTPAAIIPMEDDETDYGDFEDF
ncbi:MAG: methyl-accepting chemotaxis protein [Desulfatiglandales bacterium]